VTTVLFAGGGTGGHLMPALAIADAMVRLDPRIRPFFIGSERGVEANFLPQRPWPYELLPLQPIRRRQWWKNVTLPLALYRVVRRVEQLVASSGPAWSSVRGAMSRDRWSGRCSGPVCRAFSRNRMPSPASPHAG
jgi:UDP-N-acetylglucosamine:LPS N-acetylglucosamine transferase